MSLRQLARNGVDLGGLHGFLPGERRQDAGQALCQHGFAGAGCADQQYVVSAGSGNDHGPPRQRLAQYVRKIRHLCPGFCRIKGDSGGRGQGRDSLQRIHYLTGCMGGVDRHSIGAGLGSFRGVLGGDIQGADAAFGSGQSHGQNAGYRPQGAVQRQLAQKGSIRRDGLQLAAGNKKRKQQGQIIHRAGLADIGRGQIDGDAPVRELEPQILDGGTHAVCTFAHSGIRQAYDGKCRQTAGDIGFYRYGKAVQALQTKASGDRIHGALPRSNE